MNSVQLPASLFPPLPWFCAAWQAKSVCISIGGFYEKQSHFNRYVIAGPNGLQNLVVPITHTGEKKWLSEAQISPHSKWNREHIHAMNCAYNKAPFYEFYDYKVHEILNRNQTNLLDLIQESISFLFQQFHYEGSLEFVQEYQLQTPSFQTQVYPQVFEEKFGFRPVSALDLLFNLGPEAGDYLNQSSSLTTE